MSENLKAWAHWKTKEIGANEGDVEMAKDILDVIKERDRLREALELIAAPKRADGTYNRCREACEQLAKQALAQAAITSSEEKQMHCGFCRNQTTGGCNQCNPQGQWQCQQQQPATQPQQWPFGVNPMSTPQSTLDILNRLDRIENMLFKIQEKLANSAVPISEKK